MLTRIEIADREAANSIALVAWRLGLGWLVGKWFVLVTTNAGNNRLDRSIAPYTFAAGKLYVVAPPGARWLRHVARRPVAATQTDVGPLAVRTRRATPAEQDAISALYGQRAPDLLAAPATHRWVFEPTGDRAPDMVAPDLVWVWFAVAAAWLVGRVVRAVSGWVR